MSQKRNTAICLGLCTVLAACDSAPPTDATPGLSEAASDDVQSLNDSWAAKRSLSPYRYSMVAGTINGIIYVVGGVHTNWTTWRARLLSRVDAYNAATNTWVQVASLPGAREALNGASVIQGKLYVTGGYRWTPEGQKPTKTLFVYDPRTNTWARKADLPQPGCYGAQGVINGKLYVFMPPLRLCDPFADRDVVRFYRYNPATDTWVRRAVPPVPGEDLSGGAGGVIDGKFYLAGRDSRLHVYDPTNNTWETKASMSEPRSGMVAAVLNGKLFLVGGHSGWSDSDPMPEFEVYNPLTDTWTLKTPLAFGTLVGAAASAGGRIYYIAGRVYERGPGGNGERLLDASEVYAYTP